MAKDGNGIRATTTKDGGVVITAGPIQVQISRVGNKVKVEASGLKSEPFAEERGNGKQAVGFDVTDGWAGNGFVGDPVEAGGVTVQGIEIGSGKVGVEASASGGGSVHVDSTGIGNGKATFEFSATWSHYSRGDNGGNPEVM